MSRLHIVDGAHWNGTDLRFDALVDGAHRQYLIKGHRLDTGGSTDAQTVLARNLPAFEDVLVQLGARSGPTLLVVS